MKNLSLVFLLFFSLVASANTGEVKDFNSVSYGIRLLHQTGCQEFPNTPAGSTWNELTYLITSLGTPRMRTIRIQCTQ
jgi:hypothetical protein